MNSSPSFLEAAIPHLEPLLEEVIFIGGSVVSLYITDPAALYVRPTLDIDILSAATTYSAYQSMVDKLIAIGFSHDIRGPLCRFVKSGLIVDLMSPDESVLGFSNHWYRQALATHKIVRHILPGLFPGPDSEARHDRFHHRVLTIANIPQ